MKKIMTLILSLSLVLGLTACGSRTSNTSGSALSETQAASAPSETQAASAPSETQAASGLSETQAASAPSETQAASGHETTPESAATISETEPEALAEEPTQSDDGRTLVVYFSATGNTEKVANYIVDATGADVFELEPVNAYTNADLNYNDDSSRVVHEHDNPDEQNIELVASTVGNWDEYDTVFIGYPIWWHIAAWPVNGFVETNDFTGKTVIPFCTSASSGLGESGELLAELAGTGNWLEGVRFSSGVSEEKVVEWLEGLGL